MKEIGIKLLAAIFYIILIYCTTAIASGSFAYTSWGSTESTVFYIMSLILLMYTFTSPLHGSIKNDETLEALRLEVRAMSLTFDHLIRRMDREDGKIKPS